MSIIYVLIPIAILLTILGIYFFFWAVKTEQFHDLEKQGLSILFDDENKEDINKNITLENNTTSSQHTNKNAAASSDVSMRKHDDNHKGHNVNNNVENQPYKKL